MAINTLVNRMKTFEIIKNLCIKPSRISDDLSVTNFIAEKILEDF